MEIDLEAIHEIESTVSKVWTELCRLENGELFPEEVQLGKLEIRRQIGVCRKDMELLKRRIAELRAISDA